MLTCSARIRIADMKHLIIHWLAAILIFAGPAAFDGYAQDAPGPGATPPSEGTPSEGTPSEGPPSENAPAKKNESSARLLGTSRGDVVACVRGRIITRLEVEREMERIRKVIPDAPDDALFWKARSLLAENIVLVETAKVYTRELPDEEVKLYYTHYCEPRLDLGFVKDHLKELRQEYIVRLYMGTRLGWTDRLEGVTPDMASYQIVTPEDIRSFYRHSLEEFTTRAETRMAWVLFPNSAFPEPDERLAAAEECRTAMQEPVLRTEDMKDRWIGCLPQKEKIITGEDDAGFQEPLREFVRNAAEGEISPVIDLGAALVVAKITKKVEAKVKPFAEVQKEVARKIKRSREDDARRFIITDLTRRERIFWPPDLFDPRMKAPAQGVEEGGTAPPPPPSS